MRVKSIALSLALVISCSALGCKSASKLAWWKTADTSAETAATLAQTTTQPPQLPSEIARQAEGLSTNPVKISSAAPATTLAASATSKAPAYTATNISPYPNTGAQGYLPTTTASTASVASTTAAAPVKSALPYDPNAVPPATATTGSAATTASAPTQTDRYGMTNQDRYANANSTSAAPDYAPLGYSPTSSPENPPSAAGASTTPATVPFASSPGPSTLGDRYATQNTPAMAPVNTPPSYGSESVQPASAVASVQPYRPGGTSTYPGTSASYEVATRPDSTTVAPSTYPNQGATLYR